MQAHDVEEIIARFVGMFATMGDVVEAPIAFPSSDHDDSRPHLSRMGGHGSSSRPDDIDSDQSDPAIRYRGDAFFVEGGPHARLSSSEIEMEGWSLPRPHRTDAGDSHGSLPAHGAMHLDYTDAPVSYRDAGQEGVLSLVTQETVLDDRDFLRMTDEGVLPEAPWDTDARLEAMTAEAASARTGPYTVSDPDIFREILATSTAGGSEVTEGTTAPGHMGWYSEGASIVSPPDLSGLLPKAETDPVDLPPAATATMGANVLTNQVAIVIATQMATVTIVQGDWHETNSIRQINVWSDNDVHGANVDAAAWQQPTQAFSLAHFDRILPDEATAPIQSATGFPSWYSVDVVQGDVQITNFLRQLHVVSDGDGAVFTSLVHEADVVMGGNQTISLYDLFAGPRGYDLVVIGGSVYEGNYIEQINVMMDDDVLAGDGDASWTAATGGNVLLNQASIVNFGSATSFSHPTEALDALVARFSEKSTSIPADMGSELDMFGTQGLRVLYIEGDYFEMNVVSQMNVLGDADRAMMVGSPAADFLASAGEQVPWTVETGSNILVNSASIVDVDDVGAIRYLGGHYYSDSMLIQTELVVPNDGILRFDTDALSPEVIAFTTHDASEDDASASVVHHASFDGHYDGVAGIIA